MKKYIIVLVLIVLIASCQRQPKEQESSLSELQIAACNAADEARTCDTRLPEIGIVLKEDCCKALEKCC